MAKYVQPVMTPDEAEAMQIVLRAVLAKNVLVEHDADKLRGALEALVHAPVLDGKVPLDPAANELGKFARRSPESRKAALANFPRSGTQRMRVLGYVAQRGEKGATRDEVSVFLQLPPNVATPRVLELVEGGWLRTATDDDGNDRTRKTRAGSDAVVLVLTERAKGKLAAQKQLLEA